MKASAEPIDRPSHHHIKLPAGGSLAERVELRPLVLALGARDAVVLVEVNDLPTGPLGKLAELTLLIGRGLVKGRNPEIEDSSLHDVPLFDLREVRA